MNPNENKIDEKWYSLRACVWGTQLAETLSNMWVDRDVAKRVANDILERLDSLIGGKQSELYEAMVDDCARYAWSECIFKNSPMHYMKVHGNTRYYKRIRNIIESLVKTLKEDYEEN